MKTVVLRALLGLMLLAILTGAGVFGAVCVCAVKERAAKPSDCLIVLGAKVRPDGSLSNSLRYRCEAALEAWKSGVAENIIVCGGQGNDEPMAEAEAVGRWLAEHGVPEDRIFPDGASSDTRENFANAAKIMGQNGWSSAAVVTSDYHVQRSLWLARDAGVEACGIAAKSPQSFWGYLFARARESCSWLLYGFRQVF